MRLDDPADLDRPEVVAEVAAASERYERALADGDVAVLTDLFWDDGRCVRFGVADRQQGAGEIAAWRREHPSVPAGRWRRDTRVLAVDNRTAVVTTLFGYPDGLVEGRQSQTWVRFPAGWRIVAAHVSEMPVASSRPDQGRAAQGSVLLAVVAAHRTGQPLHHELIALGARFERDAVTAPVYRMIALAGPGVPRGGIVAAADGGTRVGVELHRLPTAAVGTLLGALPAPLAIGRVELVEGSELGLVCVSEPAGAVDVSEHGSWPAYLADRATVPI